MTIVERERTLAFRPGVVRNVTQRELPQALALASRNPSVNGFVISRIEAALIDHWRLGGALWGFFIGDHLHSMLFVGANIVPVNTDASARNAFASELIRAGRRSSSILGESLQVRDLWQGLETFWGQARAVRENQPFMHIDSDPMCALDTRVRRVVPSELDLLFPACVDMFTEEVGVSPIANGGEHQYKRRIAEVIDSGMALAVIEGGRVLFKTEVGFATNHIAQLQGVWVNPSVRGQGLAGPALAAAIVEIRSSFAKIVTLYVNDFNIPARKTYERLGFKQMATFATVLF
jgi:predicted GNAT family acetyltransferase